MRIEKGHVAGNEINGQPTARDLGLGRMMSTKKDYIGRVMAQRPALLDPDRPALVGFKPVDRKARLRAGAHFLPRRRAATRRQRRGLHDLGGVLADARLTGSGSACSSAGRSGSASACAPMIRCATATSRWRSAIRCSSIPRERGSMASFAEPERSALHGLALPGRYGRAGDDRPGDRGAHRPRARQRHRETRQAIRARHRGQHRVRRCAAGRAAPRDARRCHLRWHRPGSVDRSAEGSEPPASPRSARASARSRRSSDQSDARLVLRLRGPRVRDVLAKGVPVDLHPKRSSRAMSRHAGRLRRRADRHAGRRADLSARRSAQHGGQLLVMALGIGRRIRL